MVHAAVQSSLRSKVDLHGRALTRKDQLCFKIEPTAKRGQAFADSERRRSSSLQRRSCRIAQNGLGDTRPKAHATVPFARNDLLFTMSDNTQQASASWRSSRLCEFVFLYGRAVEPRSAGSAAWWSQTGSNRRPPACKAGALPTELWPRAGDGRNQESGNGGPGKI